MIVPKQVQAMILLAALSVKWEYTIPIVNTNYNFGKLQFSNVQDTILNIYNSKTMKQKQLHNANKISAVKCKHSNPCFSNQNEGS